MRKVFIVIERRADYSRFKPIMELMNKDKFFKLYIVVTGICLLKNHGKDVENIMNDGFKIDKKIPMFRDNVVDSGGEMVKAMARFMSVVVDELEKFRPDIVLSGFDIGANFAVTLAAAHMNIPVAHIQGGEVTGSIDESIRHAMSKFAHIHFPATDLSKKRLIKMGENPDNIYVVGCPSIDTMLNTIEIPIKELENEFEVDFSKPVVLMIQHPVTTENTDSYKQINETLEALKKLKCQVVIIMPNNDAGHLAIIKKIIKSGFKSYPTLSSTKYVNLLRHVSVLVGNSSSGIHEASTYKVPVVNIGTRQQGRERSDNIIDVPYNKNEIFKALKKAIYDKKFRNKVEKIKNIYGDGKSAKKIYNILKKISLVNIVQKKFYE